MGRKAPSPGPPTTTSQPTTGSGMEGVAQDLGLAPHGLRLRRHDRWRAWPAWLRPGSGGAQGLGGWARPPRSAWARASRSWLRAPRRRRSLAASDDGDLGRPRAGGRLPAAGFWGSAAAPCRTDRLCPPPTLISPERSSRLAAFRASRSDPRMRFGNEPFGCVRLPGRGALFVLHGPLLLPKSRLRPLKPVRSRISTASARARSRRRRPAGPGTAARR